MNVNNSSGHLMIHFYIEIWKYVSSYTEEETIFTQKLQVNLETITNKQQVIHWIKHETFQ